MGGGENTVAQSTKDFEQREAEAGSALGVSGSFYQIMSEFGPKVKKLHCETDIRPEYFAVLFPNIEELEMYSRASRRIPMDERFTQDVQSCWPKLTKFTMEVDPGFTSSCNEHLLVHILSDLFKFSKKISKVKILASQTGLKVAEFSLLLELNKVSMNVQELEEVVILSPYKMHGQGISYKLAAWFISNCPKLRLLRDVSSWAGESEEWQGVVRDGERRGLDVSYAEKTRTDSLYTIDYDSEGWVQKDTGHKFELFNNLNDDWEVVDVDFDNNDDGVGNANFDFENLMVI